MPCHGCNQGRNRDYRHRPYSYGSYGYRGYNGYGPSYYGGRIGEPSGDVVNCYDVVQGLLAYAMPTVLALAFLPAVSMFNPIAVGSGLIVGFVAYSAGSSGAPGMAVPAIVAAASGVILSGSLPLWECAVAAAAVYVAFGPVLATVTPMVCGYF